MPVSTESLLGWYLAYACADPGVGLPVACREGGCVCPSVARAAREVGGQHVLGLSFSHQAREGFFLFL